MILMDMQMPILDGYSTTRRLRASGVHTPIIALTASAMAGDRDRCLDAGCNGYVSKPLDHQQLLAELTRWCKPAAADCG
jgi:CheY-like chemotaxis protein